MRKIKGAKDIDHAKSAFDEVRKKRLTSSVDLYSMAVIAYEALTGKLPIAPDGETREAYLDKIENVQPVLIYKHNPKIPQNLGNAIMVNLSKKPESRTIPLARFTKEIKKYADSL